MAIKNDDWLRIFADLTGVKFIPEEDRCFVYEDGLPCWEPPIEQLVPINGNVNWPTPVCAKHLERHLSEHCLWPR